MKTFAGWISDEINDRFRHEMVELLGGNVELMEQVERAENEYLLFVEQSTRGESDKSIQHDLTALLNAVEVLESLYNPPGAARALFEGRALGLAGADIVRQFKDLFSAEKGRALAMAARVALDNHKVRAHRSNAAPVAERMILVETVAQIAEQAGIAVKRNDRTGNPAPFERLLQFVFKRSGIEVKPDSAIQKLLENRANVGAGNNCQI